MEPSSPCCCMQPEPVARDQEVAGGQHVDVPPPGLEGGVLVGRGRGEARAAHHDVQAAVFERGVERRRAPPRPRRSRRVRTARTRSGRRRPPRRPRRPPGRRCRGRSSRRRRPRRAAGGRWRRRSRPPPPVTSATRPSRRAGLGQPLQLGLLQRPVLDVEGLLLRAAARRSSTPSAPRITLIAFT